MTDPSNTNDEPNRIEGVRRTTEEEVAARANRSGSNSNQGSYTTDSIPRGGDYADLIDSIGIRPVDAPYFKLNVNRYPERSVLVPAGFYLLQGGTGGGKSITAVALTLCAKMSGAPVRYFYCYEARTPFETVQFENGQIQPQGPYVFGQAEGTAQNDLNMSAFPKIAENLVSAVGATDDRVGLVVFDSIALPMRAYRSRERVNQATMKEGMQPMDIAFCVEMERMALEHNVAIFGVINDDLVPFAAKLEGMTEGIVTVHSAGNFSIRSRLDRVSHQIQIESDAVDAAAAFLHYPERGRQIDAVFGFI